MNNNEKITELAEKAALEHLKKNNCPECCGSSYNSFLSGVAWKACEHEGWPVQKGGVIPDCGICGIPFDVFYAQERPLGSLFSHELQNNVPQWVKDFVDEEFPEEHYGGIEGYFEAWPLRNIFEQMVTLALMKVGGKTSPAVHSLKTIVDRFLAWPLPESVCSDGCVTYIGYPYPRSGTNLLNATEAEKMFEYVLEGMAAPTDSVFELKNQLQTALASRDLWKTELERERQKFQNETLLTGSLYREIEALRATQLEYVGALRSIVQDSIACEEPPYGEGQRQQYYFTEWAMKKVRAALSGHISGGKDDA